MKTKTLFVFTVWITVSQLSSAQNFFNQKGAMLKKCAQQIALLKTYTRQLKKGYDIVEGGINLTHELKSGEFKLHGDYYNSLQTVNPAIQKYPYVQQTVTLYNKILTLHNTVWKQAKSSGLFTGKELDYIKGVYTNLLKSASEDMEELSKLTTDGKYKLTDDQRMERIDGVYNRIQQKYKVMTSFNNRILITVKGRKQQQQDAAAIKKLYGQ